MMHADLGQHIVPPPPPSQMTDESKTSKLEERMQTKDDGTMGSTELGWRQWAGAPSPKSPIKMMSHDIMPILEDEEAARPAPANFKDMCDKTIKKVRARKVADRLKHMAATIAAMTEDDAPLCTHCHSDDLFTLAEDLYNL